MLAHQHAHGPRQGRQQQGQLAPAAVEAEGLARLHLHRQRGRLTSRQLPLHHPGRINSQARPRVGRTHQPTAGFDGPQLRQRCKLPLQLSGIGVEIGTGQQPAGTLPRGRCQGRAIGHLVADGHADGAQRPTQQTRWRPRGQPPHCGEPRPLHQATEGHPLPQGHQAVLIHAALGLLLAAGLVGLGSHPAQASLTNNSYDGNIYALYAGNGSLVPPRSSLAKALEDHRTTVVVYYLDDDAASKQFSAVVSELQRVWLNNIELIPLVTDPLQNRADTGPSDPAHYWSGLIPQVVVFNSEGQVVFDEQGAVSVDAINAAVSQATGIPLPEGGTTSTTESFNELNSEVVSR